MLDSPIVMFSDINACQVVAYWLGVDIDFVQSYLGMILNKIGFSKDDSVYVNGYTKDSYLLFMVNGNEQHRILMSSKSLGDNKYNPVVYYDSDITLDGYECRIDKYGRYDIDFIRVRYNDEDVDRVIKDYNKYEDISVSKGEYVIEFRISNVGNGLNNKKKVMNYLYDLELPVSILDIYKGICKIALLDDISVYPLIDLRLVNKENNVKEMMILADGKLVNLLVNNNGKMVSFNNMGCWSYETDLVSVDFSVIKNNGIIDFNSKVRVKENIEDYSLDLACHDVDTARKEVTSVKKLVKKIFNK